MKRVEAHEAADDTIDEELGQREGAEQRDHGQTSPGSARVGGGHHLQG